jgi:serine protease AprX
MAHAPFEVSGHAYTSLAPAASYIVLDHGGGRAGEAGRLRHGIRWVLERRDEWNVKVVNAMSVYRGDPDGWLENTNQWPMVEGLRPALEAGLLIVVSNGNTRFENKLPPVEYLAVGSCLDDPFVDSGRRVPYPDEPWGLNGDGHLRPDILGPRLYHPIPYCEVKEKPEPLSFYAQSSGTCTQVAGICAGILSLYPNFPPEALRSLLVDSGERIAGTENPAPAVNAGRALHVLTTGYRPTHQAICLPPIHVTQADASLRSLDPIERGLALTLLAKRGRCSRSDLWHFAVDAAPEVRKVAVWALEKPREPHERESFWRHLAAEPDCGVRGYWLYGLLQEAQQRELDRWMCWIVDENWSVRWCVAEYLSRYPDFPGLEKTFDLDRVEEVAEPVRAWYKKRC